MPLSLLNHSALVLFAQRTRIPTSARSIGFCAIWVCISSSSLRTWQASLPLPFYTPAYEGLEIAIKEELHLYKARIAQIRPIEECLDEGGQDTFDIQSWLRESKAALPAWFEGTACCAVPRTELSAT